MPSIGQTYNALGDKVYPKVVASAFVEDHTLTDKPTAFNSAVRSVFSDNFSTKNIVIPTSGLISYNRNNSNIGVLSVDGNGNLFFNSPSISDNGSSVSIFTSSASDDATVNLFGSSAIVTKTSVNLMDSTFSVTDSSVTMTKPLECGDVSCGVVTCEQVKQTDKNQKLLQQVKELPVVSTDDKDLYAENFVMYVGPTQHYITDNPLCKGVMYRYTIPFEYGPDEHVADSSVCSLVDEYSFEPSTTMEWLKDNDASLQLYEDDKKKCQFTLWYHSSAEPNESFYFVTVKNFDETSDILLGGDIYGPDKNSAQSIYCPFVWDYTYVPTPMESITSDDDSYKVLEYNLIFSPDKYGWKPI